MFKLIKKADIVLLIILLALGGLFSYGSMALSKPGDTLVVTLNGKVYGTYPLSKNGTYTVKDGSHINKITIKDGKAQMTFSNCPGGKCLKDGRISKTNQSIVCLPHRLVLTVKGGDDGFDSIAE